MGQLTALSQAGSSFTMVDGVATVSMDTTYEDDGKRILNLWIVSLLFLVCQCLLACYAAAPPTQDQLRKWEFDYEDEVNEEGEQVVRAVL